MDPVWTTKLSAPVGSLAAHDAHDVLFATDFDDRRYCLDAGTGDVQWDVDTASKIAAVGADAVYLRSGTTLLALDKDTGTRRWRYVDSQDISEVVVTDGLVGLRTYEYDTDLDEDRFVVLDRETGERQFTRTADCRSVVQHSGTIYLVTRDSIYSYTESSGYAKVSDSGGGIGCFETDRTTLYFGTTDVGTGVLAIDATTGIERFSTGGYTNDMILRDDTVYAAFGSGSQSCAIDTETGNTVWRLDDESHYTHQVTVGDTGVYFEGDEEISGDSSYLQAVSREWGQPRWSRERETIGRIEAVDDVVIVKSDGVLAFDSSSGGVEWRSETMHSFYTVADELFLRDGTSLYRVDPGTGSSNWSTTADDVAIDQQVYVASESTVTAFPVGGSGATAGDTEVYDSGAAGGGADTNVYQVDDIGGAGADTGAHESGEATSRDISFCPSCGTDLGGFDDVRFCPSCGQQLD